MMLDIRKVGMSGTPVPATALSLIGLWFIAGVAVASQGNRLAYLDDPVNPYYVNLDTPKLVTPQWVGQRDVQAVIVLAVDDMSDVQKYEAFLRPILNRLQAIDGRAPVSIMTKHVDPRSPQLALWLKEGLSIETHTADHPCPLLQGGKLDTAKSTYDRCVDALWAIPDARPVAFRMPCCDSMNSVSPRFFAEIFGRTTPQGRFLRVDSSVFQVFTAGDPALPRSLAIDQEGRARFGKYIPADKMMVNLIEDYPYPYVIGRLCWEIPCLMPSDWDAQYLNGKCSPTTVRDLKAAIDATVVKQGVFSLCFHPHGWITSDQVVELIDYAQRTHGPRVKFLNFRDVEERLSANLLGGHALRGADGDDQGVRVLDLNNDGFMDAMVGSSPATADSTSCLTRVWQPGEQSWKVIPTPFPLLDRRSDGSRTRNHVCFGVLQADGSATAIDLSGASEQPRRWDFDGQQWVRAGDGDPFRLLDRTWGDSAVDPGIRLRDLDGNGQSELVIGNPHGRQVCRWTADHWEPLPWTLPDGVTIVDAQGRDAGLRLIDFSGDGQLDLVFSDARRCAAWEFDSLARGWARPVFDEPRRDRSPLPMLVRADGSNNGAWLQGPNVWVQNEDTGAKEPYHVRHFRFGTPAPAVE